MFQIVVSHPGTFVQAAAGLIGTNEQKLSFLGIPPGGATDAGWTMRVVKHPWSFRQTAPLFSSNRFLQYRVKFSVNGSDILC